MTLTLMVCPKCGRSAIGRQFCGHCGSKLQPAAPTKDANTALQSVCRHCDAPMGPADFYCPDCGQPLSKVKGEPVYKTYRGTKYLDKWLCKHCGKTAPILVRKYHMSAPSRFLWGFALFGVSWFTSPEMADYYCSSCGHKF